MIEIVRAKAARAKQPFHIRVEAEGNAEPLLSGETLTTEEDVATALVALGRLFSPVHLASYANRVLTVFLEDDDPEDPDGEHLHIPVGFVDLRETPEGTAEGTKKAPDSASAQVSGTGAEDSDG